MLYIFLVESGSMMTFDMNLALQTVANLKKAIASQCQIPEDKQVLLISGGESLNLTSRVCSYSCSGTDTSPIFLFSKNSIDSPNPPKCVTDYDPDVDMSDRVQSCIDMNPNYNTVVARAEMAQQLYEMAKQQLHNCERLVHDQHLQQQGWAAVVANLEDIANSFSNIALQLEQIFNNFIEDKPFYADLLQNFSTDLKTLSMIPILDNLIANNSRSDGETPEDNSMTLLEWISQKDSQSSLEQVSEYCCRGLEQFNSEQLSKIKEEVQEVLDSCNQSNMKEVKGLEERLYGLEKLMCEAKKIVDEQKDLAQAFYQNQTRASNLRDPSILPDLCASHQQQLQVMLKNHQKLRDYRRRCCRAKEELSGNLHARLRWIVFIEKKLSDIDSKVLIYRENLRRLKKHLEVVHQIHLAPKIYLASVVEVVRRKRFSDMFLNWATHLSQQSSKLVENEIQSRQTFSSQLNSHFLQILFPGISDIPPRFANESPLPFDTELPDIKEGDVQYLRQKLPDLCDLLCVPSPVPMPQPSVQSKLSVSAIKDRPSESTIDEFETVIDFDPKHNDNNELSVQNSKDVFTEMSVTALHLDQLDDNLRNYRTQLDDKSIKCLELETKCNRIENELNSTNNSFQTVLKLSFDGLTALKSLKTSFSSDYRDIKNDYLSSFESIKKQLNDCLLLQQKEILENRMKCNKTLDDYENRIMESNTSIESLKVENNYLKESNESLNDEISSLNIELVDRNKRIDELKEEICENKKQLTLEHELELTAFNEEITKLNLSNQSLEELISQKISQIDCLKHNYEKLESELLMKFQEEKDSLRNALEKDFGQRLNDSKIEFEIQMKQNQRNNESALNELRLEMEAQKDKSLIELKEQLDSEHRHELDSLRHRFKLAISTTSIERTPSETSLEKVNLELVDPLAQEREVTKLKQLILDEKNRYEEMFIKLRKEKDEDVKNVRSAIQAERQVNFNEALNKLSNEKEVLAQELRTKQKCFHSSIVVINEIIFKFKSQESAETTQYLNEILDQIENEIKTLSSNFGSDLNESVVCDLKSQCSCGALNVIKEKELEINRLSRLLRDCDMTQSSSAIGRIERVSVLGCEVGDIVLIYYEEKFDNYIVFHLNNILHFLHTDCLEALSLKQGTGEARQRWTIAEVTDKEYCQARKAQNRYKVAVNTKFYRVKAKPWSRLANRLSENRASFSALATFSRRESLIQSNASMIASNMMASVSTIEARNSPDIK